MPAYSAWYEMYPKKPVYLPSKYPVSAGDTMSAEVKYVGKDTYELTLNDRTTGPDWTYTKTLQTSKPTIAKFGRMDCGGHATATARRFQYP